MRTGTFSSLMTSVPGARSRERPTTGGVNP